MVKSYIGHLKNSYDISDLREIVSILRNPGGCPWDREQTHETLRTALIEEAYEAVDAINQNDSAALCEELGDVLLQIVFHADLAESFDLDDIADGICKKLIYRHPHVFADTEVSGTAEVLKNWDELKKREKQQKTAAETLESVPKALPALMRAEKVQKRASKAGFDWPDISGALEKLSEEAAELKSAADSGNQAEIQAELGDLLFSVVNIARFLKAEPEEALTRSTEKFIRRFTDVERLAASRGIDMKSASIAELDKLWDEIKLAE